MIRIPGLVHIFNLGFAGGNDLPGKIAWASHDLRALGTVLGFLLLLLGAGCERIGVPRADLIIANAVEQNPWIPSS
ncbi:MAG: hypothetical protein LR011_00405 [Verrucomicrobia bacterium]|nr:hypothetical protein [Verrucomicrobiota bacterium]